MSHEIGIDMRHRRVFGRVTANCEALDFPAVQVTERGDSMHSLRVVAACREGDIVELVNGMWWPVPPDQWDPEIEL